MKILLVLRHLVYAVMLTFPGLVLAKDFNIRDYGAKGDCKTKDTKAILAAIDACAKSGGGRVYVPTGEYLSAALYLKSNMELYMEAGAAIHNNYYRLNTDGIDPTSSKNVRIANCYISTGDDCIVPKSDDGPCENIVVENCVLESNASAIKLGTGSKGDFRNVVFNNIVIKNSEVGIALMAKDGGTYERINFSNIVIENQDTSGASGGREIFPIIVDIEKRHADSKISRINQLSFNNIYIKSGAGVIIQGMPESLIENLVLHNISFEIDKPKDYAIRRKRVVGTRTTRDDRDTLFVRKPSYITVAYAKNVMVSGINVQGSKEDWVRYPRSAFQLHQVNGGWLKNVMAPQFFSFSVPVIYLSNSRNMAVEACSPGTRDKDYLKIDGSSANNTRICYGDD